ncbi:hypothetical protein [Kordia sp.]|uniref:hypothetical protein n=1 Tax=Kordia sp. TaxID=1965332 RepID=UPI003D6AB283
MRTEELILTASGILLTLVTLIIGILKFSKQKKREFQKTFFSTQLEIYKQAAHHAAALYVYPKSSDEYMAHRYKYKNLFLGEMCIVEDKIVEERMVQFNTILNWYHESKKESEAAILKKQLKHFALVLAHTLRNSSIETWKLKNDVLGELFNDFSINIEEDKVRIKICRQMISGELTPELYDKELNKQLNELRMKEPIIIYHD